MRFEWDEEKSQANQKKHSVTFEEAQSVFFDENALLFDDPDHSEEEQRYLLLGFSVRIRVLLVVHCVREKEDVIRLISARRATRKECKVLSTKGEPK